MKTVIKFLLLILIIFAAIFSTAFLLLDRASDKIPVSGTEFEIKVGDSASAIAFQLKERGLITSMLFFKVMTRVSGLDRKLQSGYVKINSGDRTTEIMSKIMLHEFVTVSFTIPEGYTWKEINQILIKNEIVREEEIQEFLSKENYLEEIGLSERYKSAEGFLFPETYTFYKGTKIDKIYKTMVKLFYQKISQIAPDYSHLSLKEFYDKIILASIIEKEVKSREEAPIVAGIFYNRMKQKMRLQSCATVQYVLSKPKERLLEEDLRVDSPYNTYLHDGLPPAPIANPGFEALNAAFHPQESEYLFFVVKDPEKGTHQFSKTYEEHLRAQRKYKVIKGFY